MITIRTASKAYNGSGDHVGPGKWLALIYEANRIEPGTFDEPKFLTDRVESYPNADVVHHYNDTVSIVSTTEEGTRILTEAALRLNLEVTAL